MNPQQVRYTADRDNPNQLLIITIEDGTNTTVFEPDEAVDIYHQLGKILHDFELLKPAPNNHDTPT